jgi:UDP-N-acetylmuramoylalanine--D-glutamate ligase
MPPGLADLQALQSEITVSFGALDESLLAGADCLVISPGLAVSGAFFERARVLGIPLLGDIELFARAHSGREAAPQRAAPAPWPAPESTSRQA